VTLRDLVPLEQNDQEFLMSDDTDVTTRPNDLESQPTNDDRNVTGSADLDSLDAAEGRVGGLDAERDAQAEAEDEAAGEGEDSTEDSGEDSGGTRRGGSRVRLLEREGEVAADFLERLLDIADLDGDIEVDIDGDRASVAIVDSEDGRVPRRMVGADGKALDALQELTRLAVQAETGERSRLMLDIAGHRAARRAVVVEIAQTAIAEVKTTGAQKALEDMSAFERKIVHDEVAAAGLGSESEGVEPHRHIIVFPA
jgi:spoIIIJ-associated protein